MPMGDAIHGTRKGLAAVGQSAAETARQSMAGEVSHHGAEVAGRIRRWSSRYYDRARDTALQWQHLGEVNLDRMRGGVRRHAIPSTVVAFAVGFLISRFLFRR